MTQLYRNQSFTRKFAIMRAEAGLVGALRWSVGHAIYKIGLKDGPTRRRIAIARRLEALFGSTIAYGPFKGLKFAPGAWWGTGDRAGMMLGLYEQEILTALTENSPTYDLLIDLGAADGYYAVGGLVGGLFEHAICFEASDAGRARIAETAALNGVANRITVNGYADREFYHHISEKDRARGVLLVDIEGGEFDLFTDEVFAAFSGSLIIIELHDWFFDDGAARLAALKARAAAHFAITTLTATGRDLSPFVELETFSDDDRWLICSEGRARAMTWLRLDPLNPANEPPQRPG